MNFLNLEDMTIVGKPSAKLLKACAVIASHLHAGFKVPSSGGYIYESERSCIISSLAVRDFLFRVGFTDVEVRPVTTMMKAEQDGEQKHSLAIGYPGDRAQGTGSWAGHLVVVLPGEGYLIDTTLYPARRDQWSHLRGMVAAPMGPGSNEVLGLKPIAGYEQADGEGYVYAIVWLDNPANRSWKKTNDAKLKGRRAHVVDAMVSAFGEWDG